MAETVATFKDERLQKFLKGMSKRYRMVEKRQREYVKLISISVFQDIIRHFENEEGPGNKKWDEWSPRYAKFLQKIGKGGNMILQDKGQIKGRIAPIEKGRNFRKDNRGILWFNRAKTKSGFPYAYHHDEKRSSHKGNPRSFMWLSDKAFKKISKETLMFIGEGKK